jgi:DNA-binding transcriptional ArsR family regulator
MNICSYIDMATMDLASSQQLADMFKALADPTRVRMIALLADDEVCVHELADKLSMGQSAISHQLRTLRQLRIVRQRRDGRHVYYRLDDDHVRDILERAREHLSHG